MAARPQDVMVPQLRVEIHARRLNKAIVAEDPVRRVRVAMDPLAIKVMQALADRPMSTVALRRAVKASPIAVLQRVRLLNRYLFLQTPRASAQIAIKASADATELWPSADLADAPMTTPGAIMHGCVTCGGCCHGTDVGPLRDDEVARIGATDWKEYMPAGIGGSEWLTHVPAGGDRTVKLMTKHCGRCVFLNDKKLCTIHSETTAETKPNVCFQFPHTFTRTPAGIDISFSTECRAWWKARANGAPVLSQEQSLRDIIRRGGPVVDLPLPVPVWNGVDLDHEGWLSLRRSMIDGVMAAADLPSIFLALLGPSARVWRSVHADQGDGEAFILRSAWGIPAPQGDGPGDVVEAFFGLSATVDKVLSDGLDGLSDRYRRAGDLANADRMTRIRGGLAAILNGRSVDDLVPFSAGLEIWRDMALTCLYSHEVVRRGPLLSGVSQLALRILLAHRLAGLAAESSLRARISEQDTVDGMVLATKMMRGSVVLDLLGQVKIPLVKLMIFNYSVFLQRSPPVAVDPLFDAV